MKIYAQRRRDLPRRVELGDVERNVYALRLGRGGKVEALREARVRVGQPHRHRVEGIRSADAPDRYFLCVL